MNKKVKQRLAGAIVLIIIACILLPVVFHKNSIKSKLVAFTPSIPESPQKPQVAQEVRKAKNTLDEQYIVLSKKELALEKNEALKYFKKSDSKQINKRWFIQVASFQNKTDAKKTVSQLKQAHVKQSILIKEAHLTNSKKVYRVIVGPFAQSLKVKQTRANIYKLTKLDGLILINNSQEA